VGVREQGAEAGHSDVQTQDVELGDAIPDFGLRVEHGDDEDLRLDHILECSCLDLGGGHKAGRCHREQLKGGEELRAHG